MRDTYYLHRIADYVNPGVSGKATYMLYFGTAWSTSTTVVTNFDTFNITSGDILTTSPIS
jgi:hypothetical protein